MQTGKDIDHWSLNYALLKTYAVGLAYNLFYRKRKIANLHKLPKGAPVIIAPNHQNALMDALALVSLPHTQPVFLARSDVFKGKFVIWFLTGCKILPIYRIRDGRSNLQKNDEVFDASDVVMRNKRTPLVIYPEGNHSDRRRLRPLQKGIFRIAFRAQEEYGSQPGVKIVPAGIDYEHYWKLRRNQFINLGDPIEVSEFWDAYQENPSLATNQLRDCLADGMKKVMIHIETETYYDLYMGMRVLYRSTLCKQLGLNEKKLNDVYTADKQLIASLDTCLDTDPEKIQHLDTLYKEYTRLRDHLHLRDWITRKPKYNILANLMGMALALPGFPLALWGLINNAPHLFIPLRLIKGIKDTQFYSTALYGSGLLIFTLYSLLLFILGLLLLPQWWMAFAYLPCIPLSGIFMLAYRTFYIKSWIRIKYTTALLRNGSPARELQKRHAEILQLTNSIITTNQ